jgi:hypothetical protein
VDFLERRVQVGPVPVGREVDGVLVAEEEFDGAVLEGLEARGGSERAAERRVFRGRQGRENIPRLVQLGHDARHAREHLESPLQVVLAHALARGLELVNHELHPQLGSLVLHDEEHLVVIGRARMLRGEELVEAKVIAIAHLAGEIETRAVVIGSVGHVSSLRASRLV